MLRIKTLPVLAFLLLGYCAFSQNHLPKPSVAFLKRTEIIKPPIYEYFEKYVGTISGEKKQRRVTDSVENYVCAWEEKFKKGIYFKFDSCSQTDIEITIDFVNYPKSEIVHLVDTFYNEPRFSSWNKDKTIYQPINDGDAGCYIEVRTISKHKKQLVIRCGE